MYEYTFQDDRASVTLGQLSAISQVPPFVNLKSGIRASTARNDRWSVCVWCIDGTVGRAKIHQTFGLSGSPIKYSYGVTKTAKVCTNQV